MPPKKPLNDYAKYSGIAFKMIAIILIGVLAGRGLDKLIHFRFPIFTVIFTILFVGLSVYSVIRDLLKK